MLISDYHGGILLEARMHAMVFSGKRMCGKKIDETIPFSPIVSTGDLPLRPLVDPFRILAEKLAYEAGGPIYHQALRQFMDSV